MTAARRYTREQILALDPAMTLADLAACLGVSEPVVRQMNRSGELAKMGIVANKWGAQWRIVTASVWRYLGLGADSGASTEATAPGRAGKERPTASALRPVRGARPA